MEDEEKDQVMAEGLDAIGADVEGILNRALEGFTA